jgi:hypothetical protein
MINKMQTQLILKELQFLSCLKLIHGLQCDVPLIFPDLEGILGFKMVTPQMLNESICNVT